MHADKDVFDWLEWKYSCLPLWAANIVRGAFWTGLGCFLLVAAGILAYSPVFLTERYESFLSMSGITLP